MKNIEILKKPYVLSTMLQDELEAVGAIAVDREFGAGEFIFKQGEAAMSMFIIIAGSVEILKKGPDGVEKSISVLGPGAPLGEMALVDLSPRAATARAKDRAWMCEIAYFEMESLFASRPEIAVKFFRALVSVLCKRIR